MLVTCKQKAQHGSATLAPNCTGRHRMSKNKANLDEPDDLSEVWWTGQVPQTDQGMLHEQSLV